MYDPIYYAVRDNGARAAVNLYRRLKTEKALEYDFSENFPLFVGYKLYANGKVAESLPFFQLDIEEFPDSFRLWMTHYYMGLAAKETGDLKLARRALTDAHELNPDSQEIADLLAEMEND